MKVNLAGNMKATELEKSIGRTLVSRYGKKFETYLLENLKKEGENFFIPEIECFCDYAPRLRTSLIELYNSELGSFSHVEDIPDTLKLLQGALLDGLVYGVNTETGKVDLYTMNFSSLLNLDVDSGFEIDKCVEKNREGILHAYRIDVTYYDETGFQFKATKLNKNTNIVAENFILVPYLIIAKAMSLFHKLFGMGSVLKVTQSFGGSSKERYLTTDYRVIERYCDEPRAVSDLSPAYFPLKAFFYAPVLGAPSTTSMVSKVNLFNLDKIEMVKTSKQITVKKPTNVLESMVYDNESLNFLTKLRVEDPWKFSELLDSMPSTEKVLKGITADTITTSDLSNYLNSISESDKKKFYDIMKGYLDSEVLDSKIKLMAGYNVVSPKDSEWSEEEVRDLLKNNICSILIRKSDCSLSKIIGTNSPQLLEKMYGSGYFGKFESFNHRFDELVEELKLGRPIEDAVEYCGFGCDEQVLEMVKELSAKPTSEMGTFADELKSVLSETQGIKPVSRSSTSNILVRKCFAYNTEEGGVSDYYRYIDVKKIQKLAILE